MANPGVESIFDAQVQQALTEAAATVLIHASENVLSKGLPQVILDAMSVKNFKREGNSKYSIEVEVDLKKAPMARAFELGSGIHATRGDQGTYVIKPRNASMLAFEWNPDVIPWGSPKFIGLAGKKFLFRYVDHPGVEQKAFLLPAAEQSYPTILGIVNRVLLGTASLSFGLVIE